MNGHFWVTWSEYPLQQNEKNVIDVRQELEWEALTETTEVSDRPLGSVRVTSKFTNFENKPSVIIDLFLSNLTLQAWCKINLTFNMKSAENLATYSPATIVVCDSLKYRSTLWAVELEYDEITRSFDLISFTPV